MAVTIVCAIPSWLRIMKTAMAMTSVGAALRATRPVGVSPMVRCTRPPTAAAIAAATRKISTAARTFGRYESTRFTNPVTAGMFSVPTADTMTKTSSTHCTTSPTSLDGLPSGEKRPTYSPPRPWVSARRGGRAAAAS